MPTWELIKTFNPANSRAFNYVVTINNSHVQTLTKVAIYVPQSVFTHGQLYVAMSRVESYNGLQFALAPPSMVSTFIFCLYNINANMGIDLNF